MLRQFDIRPFIPRVPENSIHLHNISGRSQQNWETAHHLYIVLWASRATLVVAGDDTRDCAKCNLGYMDWYRSVTRHQILNPRLAQHAEKEFERTHGATTYLVY